MTVFVYLNTRKQVDDKDHIANVDAAEKWFEEDRPAHFRTVDRRVSVRPPQNVCKPTFDRWNRCCLIIAKRNL